MPTPTNRTLIFGGPVLTQNERRETHEALVLEGDTVVATGSFDDMRSLAGASARRIDVEGACVMPGILDSHPHFLHTGAQDMWAVNLSDARDHADIVARIRAHVAHVPAGMWVFATHVGEPNYMLRRSYKDLAEGRLPHRRVLDTAAPDHPLAWIGLPAHDLTDRPRAWPACAWSQNRSTAGQCPRRHNRAPPDAASGMPRSR